MYPSPAPQGLPVPRYLARFGMSRETYNLILLEREKAKESFQNRVDELSKSKMNKYSYNPAHLRLTAVWSNFTLNLNQIRKQEQTGRTSFVVVSVYA